MKLVVSMDSKLATTRTELTLSQQFKIQKKRRVMSLSTIRRSRVHIHYSDYTPRIDDTVMRDELFTAYYGGCGNYSPLSKCVYDTGQIN
jgi:hypothetical protein